MMFPIILLSIGLSIASGAPTNEPTKGIPTFALNFYQSVKSTPGNIIISPLSVASALALLSQASNGKTYDQLVKGLNLSDDKTTTANQCHEYYEMLLRNAGNAELSIANQIYVNRGYEIKPEFRDVATTKFMSAVGSLNFGDSVSAAKKINHFVDEKTKGKIKDIIAPNAISSNTRAMLVNAIYFKGQWENQFNKALTKQEPFFTTSSESVLVDFMHNKGRFNYTTLNDLDATAIAMKYANSSFSFVIVLPNSRTGLSALESKLKNYDLSRITHQMCTRKVKVTIPKFKTEFEINLNAALQRIGITEMFTSSADLTGLLVSDEPLQISDVLHKAFIEVNEEGSEAAGATVIDVGVTSIQTKKTLKFRADHPFVYFIRDDIKNTILFSGRIVEFNGQ
ncbi:serine protease inhibitor 42Dd-like isoform X2 [Sitodiplosis mosellana]|uniref:serine protease inhibitor 42Dd-like isoform X1 n=1 Tax=Sitodiplosis mosellana TaxID=263140 RepID=UPI0024452D77|nr:serine protease inhibitor 42Dd-like isoform X1 [Sitodiplosis mosellana]XP_055298181.1 serine protease inhibitor 42Dd-like isoform X2 [Sitodiplosis mosellana]